MEIYLVRHTPPKVEAGICYGQTDLPVDDNFQSDVEKIKKEIPITIGVIYSSPLIRCKILAEELSKAFNISGIDIDDRLKELNFGKWEMKKWETIDQNEFREWESDLLNYKIPEGEKLIALQNRVNSFIDDLLKRKIEKVLISTHAGVIRCFFSKFKNISLTDTLRIPVEYSTVHIIQINQ
jgi:alpha-ribazole phosphatase